MDIRDEIDVMLDNLKKGGKASQNPPAKKKEIPVPEPRRSVYDKMSVDELVNALSDGKKTTPVPENAAKKPARASAEPRKENVKTHEKSADNNSGIPRNLLDILSSGDKEPSKPAVQHKPEPKAASAKKNVNRNKPTEVKTPEPEPEKIPVKMPEPEKTVDVTEAETDRKKTDAKPEKADVVIKSESKQEKMVTGENVDAETKAESEQTKPEKSEKKKKKRIVINRELPDYEEIRRRSIENDLVAVQPEKSFEPEIQSDSEPVAEDIVETPAIEPETSVDSDAEENDEIIEAEADETEQTDTFDDENNAASDEEEDGDADDDENNEAEPEKKSKKGFFAGLKSIFSRKKDDDEDNDDETEEAEDSVETEELEDTEEASDPIASEEDDNLSAAELIDAAISEIEALQSETGDEADDTLPVEPEISETMDESASDELISNMREDAEALIAELEEKNSAETETEKENQESDNTDSDDAEQIEIDVNIGAQKKKGRVVSALERILDENPQSISHERSEKTEEDEIDVSLQKKSKGKFKRSIYAFLGVIFTILAVIGLITSINLGIKHFRSFTVGETKRDSFTKVIYPAVIMDIESFAAPNELSSEQVISAALWSLVMSDEDMAKYEKTFDIISVPAIDVEAYAARLFGTQLPSLTHSTVGSGELKFYYNEETKSYNVPVNPITFTYEPYITSVSKSGNQYTVTVDYYKELPSWMKESENFSREVSKTVEFRLIEQDGAYTIASMTTLKVNAVN